MKRWLTFLLLVGALLGLLAQETAFASAPALPSAETAFAAAMSDECAEMMGIKKSQKSAPCKGLTLDCIAAMGCVVPLVAADLATGLTSPHIYGALGFWPTISVLTGKSFAPDPDPPTNLG